MSTSPMPQPDSRLAPQESSTQPLRISVGDQIYVGRDMFKIDGNAAIAGSIDVNTSKNGAMGIMCAALLNKGRTILHGIPRIAEVDRMLEVFSSIGVECVWIDSNSLQLTPPVDGYRLEDIDKEAASKTRSILMLIGAMIHHTDEMVIPRSSGCNLGTRPIQDHQDGISAFGAKFSGSGEAVRDDIYKLSIHVTCRDLQPNFYVFGDQGDTSTENVMIAAAGLDGTSRLYGSSSNYMVREVRQFLQCLGVRVEVIDVDEVAIHGRKDIHIEGVEYTNSEDPIEAMTLLTMAIIKNDELTVRRIPLRYIRFELGMLARMNVKFTMSEPYLSRNGATELVDVTIHPTDRLVAPKYEIQPRMFPGINPDSAPFFVLIATQAEGETVFHDWIFDGRAEHLLKLNELGANIKQLSEHKLVVKGKTPLTVGDSTIKINGVETRGKVIEAPDALRPAMIQLLGAMNTDGIVVIDGTYQTSRGYQDFYRRVNELGANIEYYPPAT